MTNHTLQRNVFQTGAVLAGIAVILGAFGAHGLKDLVDEKSLTTFETGVRYQFMHAIAIIFLATFIRRLHENVLLIVYRLFYVGIILFSLSLYLLSTISIWGTKQFIWIGAITPFGGLCFIVGWFWLAVSGYKLQDGIKPRSHSKSELD